MSSDVDLEALARSVRYLEDRIAIADCINRHARGCDRHDIDLLSSAYWPDGVDEHGHTVNAGAAYAAWANATHAATTAAHLHHVTTHTCEVHGNTAHAESYVLVVLLTHDGRHAQCISGRYVDRLEKRDGEWRIALRRSTVEAMFGADASVLQTSFFRDQGYLKGTRDTEDVSYVRPLTLDGRDEQRW